jgi:hypothetical protein
MKTALFVVTHETPDDVEEYDRMWYHMSDDAKRTFKECSRATILLWDAICRSGAVPYRCSLRRIGNEYAVIHLNVYHAIESGRAGVISWTEESFRRKEKERFSTYGNITNGHSHPFHKVFFRALKIVALASPAVSTFVTHVAFFDELVVARSARASPVYDAFRAAQAEQRIAILCDDHDRSRANVADPESEGSLLDEAGRVFEDTNAVYPKAFVVPLGAMDKVSMVVAPAEEDSMRMCVISLRRVVGSTEIRPPAFWQLHQYISSHFIEQECESIEDAIIEIQKRVISGARAMDIKDITVPKMIHQIWVGKPIPDKLLQLQQQIIEIHGRDNVTIHGNDDLSNYKRTLESFPILDSYANLSDIMRLEILYKHGGYYLDSDFQIYQSIFNIESSSVMIVKEHLPIIQKSLAGYSTVCGGYMGSNRYSLIILLYMSHIRRFMIIDSADQYISNMSIGPYLIASMYKAFGSQMFFALRRKVIQEVPSCFLFDTKSKHIKMSRGTINNGIGRHLYDSSWH